MREAPLNRRVEPVEAREGWVVLHLFCKLADSTDAEAVTTAVTAAEGAGQQIVTFALLGHKADLGFMLLGPDLAALRRVQSALRAAGLEAVASYVSLTEVSEYAGQVSGERLEARLHPKLPPTDMRAVCVYPMSKRRDGDANWYQLDFDQRSTLMHGHGDSGRRFSGRVRQFVTGSTGLDDYEWVVTLFATSPDDLKECVHKMRFDEVSARYSNFGPFYTGFVAPLEEVLAACGLEA
jgi:chlorite dismutase